MRAALPRCIMESHRAAFDHFGKPRFEIRTHAFVIVQSVHKNQFHRFSELARDSIRKINVRLDNFFNTSLANVALKFGERRACTVLIAINHAAMRIYRMNLLSASSKRTVTNPDRGFSLE